MCFVRKVHAIQHGNSTKSSAIIIKAMKQSLLCTHNHVILYTLQYLALIPPLTLHFRPKNLLKRLDTFDVIIYYTSMYVCMYMCRYVCIYVYMHACVHACMYVYVYVHMYRNIYIYALGLSEKDKIRNFD